MTFLDRLSAPRTLKITGWATLIFGVALSVCNSIIAPGFQPGMIALELAATSERARDILTAWGPAGRDLFLNSLVLDFVFPAVLGFWLSGHLQRRVRNGVLDWKILPVFPLVAAASDWLENFCQIATVTRYPADSSVTVLLTAGFASFKLLLLFSSVFGLWFRLRQPRFR